MIKYVNYGNPRYGVHLYVITMFRTDLNNYVVEVIPCDTSGTAVSDAVVRDIFPTWWDGYKFYRKQYKEFYNYVNNFE